MKRGKGLGGRAPRRGGRLTRTHREHVQKPHSRQLLFVVAAGLFILGGVGGFAWGMDRQLRGGILEQRQEAMQREDWAPLESLPSYVAPAFIVVVDPAFEDEGTLRTGNEGTTISADLVRQIHLLGDGLTGEAKALVMAPVIENRLTRPQLMELYLNRVYLGRSQEYPIYGISEAALEYFGKSPRELTLGEVATLAGLLLEPRIDRPEEGAGAVGIRRNEVLRILALAGYITPQQYSEAIRERLAFQPGLTEMPMTRRIPTPADTAVIRLPLEYLPQPEPPDPN